MRVHGAFQLQGQKPATKAGTRMMFGKARIGLLAEDILSCDVASLHLLFAAGGAGQGAEGGTAGTSSW